MEAHEMTCEGRCSHCVGQWLRPKCHSFSPITELKTQHSGKCFRTFVVDRPRVPLPVQTIRKFKTQRTSAFLVNVEKTIFVLCRKVRPTKWIYWFASPHHCRIRASIHVGDLATDYTGLCAPLCESFLPSVPHLSVQCQARQTMDLTLVPL